MPEEKLLTKVAFRDDDGMVETLWAYNLGEDLYQLDNTPWYQYGISWKDVVEAVPESEGGLPLFRRVVEKSGYRTLRVSLEEPATADLSTRSSNSAAVSKARIAGTSQ